MIKLLQNRPSPILLGFLALVILAASVSILSQVFDSNWRTASPSYRDPVAAWRADSSRVAEILNKPLSAPPAELMAADSLFHLHQLSLPHDELHATAMALRLDSAAAQLLPRPDDVGDVEAARAHLKAVLTPLSMGQASRLDRLNRQVARQDAFDRADRETRRLPPSAFGALPSSVRADLERRGCTVPQIWHETVPGNVISGNFRTSALSDWAVLCSVNRVSSILVYWAGRVDSVAELGSTPDRHYLQTVGGGEIGYSRAIDVVSEHFIRQHYQWYGGPRPPPLDHEGINDAFVEKASDVWYWYKGKWLRLTGAD